MPFRSRWMLSLIGAGFFLLVSTLPAFAQMRLPRLERFWENAPEEGAIAPDFTLQTLEGDTFTLSEAWAEKPVVLEFGSFT